MTIHLINQFQFLVKNAWQQLVMAAKNFHFRLSFFPRSCLLPEIFREYVEKYGLAKYIRFNSWVDWVMYDSASGKFEVTSRDLKAKETRDKEPFDYVIVATGHFNYPNMISFPGQDSFTGQIIHSKQFLDANRFKGET